MVMINAEAESVGMSSERLRRNRNHVPPHLLPYEIRGLPNPGLGFGLGSRVLLEGAQFAGTGSDGEYGWDGAAKTSYWVDPAEIDD